MEQKEQLSKLGASKGRTPPTPRELLEKGRKGSKAANADNPVTDVLATVSLPGGQGDEGSVSVCGTWCQAICLS